MFSGVLHFVVYTIQHNTKICVIYIKKLAYPFFSFKKREVDKGNKYEVLLVCESV